MRDNQPGMSLIVKTITRFTAGLILIYGIYIVLQGHISPGGGFAGGVIIALSFINLILAFGKEGVLKKLNQARVIFLMGLGAVTFFLLATFGFINKAYYPESGGSQFKLFTAGFIPLCDIFISLLVGMGLLIIFLALVSLSEERKGK